MKRRRANATPSKLDARAVRQMLRGYRRANAVTREEERAWAIQLTPQRARQIFIELCRAWEHGRMSASKQHALDQLEIARARREQRIWVRLAQRMRQR